jgi:hypothetical protein
MFIALPLQQWLYERASVLCYVYIKIIGVHPIVCVDKFDVFVKLTI